MCLKGEILITGKIRHTIYHKGKARSQSQSVSAKTLVYSVGFCKGRCAGFGCGLQGGILRKFTGE